MNRRPAVKSARKPRRDILRVASRDPYIIPSLAQDASPEAYAEAMVMCQGYAPACSDACECLDDGFCFSKDGTAFKVVHEQIKRMVTYGRPVYERAWLKVALDALNHHRMLGSKCLDALKLVAINQRVRREYKGER